jgi:syntaxin 1B/2/3
LNTIIPKQQTIMQKESQQNSTRDNSLQMQFRIDGDAKSYALFEECRQVEQDLNVLDDHLDQLKLVFQKVPFQSDVHSAETSQLKSSIQNSYCAILEHIEGLRSRPGSDSARDVAHLRKVIVRLKATVQRYERIQADFRRDSEQTARRQFRIVHPKATEAEVDQAVCTPGMPIFQQAVSNEICLRIKLTDNSIVNF